MGFGYGSCSFERIFRSAPGARPCRSARCSSRLSGSSGWERTGSIAAVDWLAVALVAGLSLAVVLASGGAVTVPRLGVVGLAGLLALAAWTGLSLLWSPLPTLGSDEVQLLVFDAIALALALFTLRGPVDRIAALACVALVPAGVALAVAVQLLGAGDVDPYFDGGRLQLPVTYANAEAALFLIGLWPAVALAAGRAIPIWVRIPALAAAALALSGWLATQSKGGGIGLIASTIVVFAVSPGRLRLAVPALVAAAIVAAAAAPLTSPYRVDSDAIAGAADDAGRALFAVLVAGLLLGAAYVALDRRTNLSERSARRAGVLAGVLTLTAAVAGAAVLVAATGRPDRALGRAWDAFSEYHPDTGGTATHLVTLGGSNRYDFWRVSLAGAGDAPMQGIGARLRPALPRGGPQPRDAGPHPLARLRDAARGGRRRARAPSRRAAPAPPARPPRHAPPQHPGRRRARRRDRLPCPRLRRLDLDVPQRLDPALRAARNRRGRATAAAPGPGRARRRRGRRARDTAPHRPALALRPARPERAHRLGERERAG